jgi:hypothetical protein
MTEGEDEMAKTKNFKKMTNWLNGRPQHRFLQIIELKNYCFFHPLRSGFETKKFVRICRKIIQSAVVFILLLSYVVSLERYLWFLKVCELTAIICLHLVSKLGIYI